MSSLQGLRVLNTRPTAQARALTLSIQKAGGLVVECPTLEINPLPTTWLKSLRYLQQVDYAIFVSPNAVSLFFEQLQQSAILWPAHIKVIAIGQGSATSLKHFNVPVFASPVLSTSEHLLQLPCLQTLKNQRVLLGKGKGGRTLIEEQLANRGAEVIKVEVYTRALPHFDSEQVRAIWCQDLVDVLVFTSEQSLHNFLVMLGEEGKSWLQQKPTLVISKRLAQAAKEVGMQKIRISAPDKILQDLLDFNGYK